MLAPSKAMPTGPVPTVLAPRGAPSEARSLVTLLLPQSATQMLAPSKAMPYGDWPTGNLIPDRFAPYQRNWAMDSGFIGVPEGPGGPCSPGSPLGPIGPVSPLGPTGPTEPVSPLGPAGPIGPVSPLGPESPAGPVSPFGPASPAGPMSPFGPVRPVGPRGPCSPFAPSAPCSPLGPWGPVEPARPGGPCSPRNSAARLVTTWFMRTRSCSSPGTAPVGVPGAAGLLHAPATSNALKTGISKKNPKKTLNLPRIVHLLSAVVR